MRLSNDRNLKTEAELLKEQEEFIKNEEAKFQRDKLMKGNKTAGGQLDEALM